MEQLKTLRRIRSFVRRQGRLTIAQASALETLWDKYGLSVAQKMRDLKPETVLEIGFGNGMSLLAMAKATSETDYIGIEVHRPGVGSLLHEIDKASIKNIRIYQEDAIDVLEQCIPDNSLARLQLYFPDPWHKKRHYKRRIVQPEFAQLIRKKLKKGGVFHAATDWENYAEHILAVMDVAEGFKNMAGAGYYSEKPDYRPHTKFEARGQRLGHGVWDLLFEKI